MKKILVLGLDNAGKTSILTAINKRFNYEEDVAESVPTRRIERKTFNFLGIDITTMDFGGQKQYREEYLKNSKKFLSSPDLVFYVIDAQDYDRYMESLDYLEPIFIFFKEEQSYPPIIILFHKFDPEITGPKNVEMNKKILTLKQSLTKYSQAFDLFFFETSIYDIKSIMDAFSSGLSLLFDKMEMFSQLFADLSKNYNSILISLFDSKGITIGEHYKSHLQVKEKMKIYDIYLDVQKRIKEENKEIYEFSDNFEDGTRFSGVVEVLNYGNLDFYLLFIVEEEEDLEKTINVLDKIEAAKSQIEKIILQMMQ